MYNKPYIEFEKYRDFKHNGYRIDTSVAYAKQDPTSKRNYQGIIASFGFIPEWKYELNGKSDVTFGVRTSAVIGEVFSKTKNGLSHGTHGSINLTGVVDYNFDLTKDVRGYVGVGAVFYINSKNIKDEEMRLCPIPPLSLYGMYNINGVPYVEDVIVEVDDEKFEELYKSGKWIEDLPEVAGKEETAKATNFGFGPIIKVHAGVKVKDKWSIGVFGGYGNKGIAGLEFGYKFLFGIIKYTNK